MGTGERTLTSAPQPRTARQTLNQSGTEPLEEGAQFTWETEAEVGVRRWPEGRERYGGVSQAQWKHQ